MIPSERDKPAGLELSDFLPVSGLMGNDFKCSSACLHASWLTDWLTVFLIVLLTDWLTNCLTEWLTVLHWLTDSLSDCLTVFLLDCLYDCLFDLPTNYKCWKTFSLFLSVELLLIAFDQSQCMYKHVYFTLFVLSSRPEPPWLITHHSKMQIMNFNHKPKPCQKEKLFLLSQKVCLIINVILNYHLRFSVIEF